MQTSPSLDATKICQAVSWRQSDTTDRRLSYTVARFNQVSDIWVRAEIEVGRLHSAYSSHRLSFDGKDERRNRQHFRCFRIIWYKHYPIALSASQSPFDPGAYAVGHISDEERFDVVRHACPGPGACGGMFTANTMSSVLEVLGISLPYSSSTPAVYPGMGLYPDTMT
jgi:hypothetical protein